MIKISQLLPNSYTSISARIHHLKEKKQKISFNLPPKVHPLLLPLSKKDLPQSIPSPDSFYHRQETLMGLVQPKSSLWSVTSNCTAWPPNLAHCGGVGPLSSKRLLKKSFFFTTTLIFIVWVIMILMLHFCV